MDGRQANQELTHTCRHVTRCRTPRRQSRRGELRRAWVLLETVIASGLLIAGLAVIGAQVQSADSSIHEMRLKQQAVMLAEMSLAQLDLGLIELDSVDREQEEEYGPRYPDFAWRLNIEESGIDGMYVLALEILYKPQSTEDYGSYQEGEFDFELAEVVFTAFALRPQPEPLDLASAVGLPVNVDPDDPEQGLGDLKCECIGDGFQLDQACFVDLPLQDLIQCATEVANILGIDPMSLLGGLPPGLLDGLDLEGEGEADGGGEDTP